LRSFIQSIDLGTIPMSTGLSLYLMQFLGQTPLLIACVIGFVLALVYWNRVPGPARMTCLAVVLLVVASFGQTWAQQFVVQNRIATGSPGVQVAQTLSTIALIGGFVRAGAIGMLIAAVFMGRPQPGDSRGFQVMQTPAGAPGWQPPAPPAPPPPMTPPGRRA
jgi:hypothetical protein